MELSPQLQELAINFVGIHQDSDLAKNDHAIYRIGHRGRVFTVLFYSPNEIPLSLPGNNRVSVFGSKSKIREIDDWADFVDEVSSRDGDIEGKDLQNDDLAVVECSPLSLIKLAISIDPSNKDLPKLMREIDSFHGGERFREFADSIIAGKLIDKDGNEKSSPDNEGEILMLQTLLGDKEAEGELRARKAFLMDKDSERFDCPALEKRKSESGLVIDDLVAVHVTDYPPITGLNGEKIIKSTFDGSGQKTPRCTIHFALNHQVCSHRYGNWTHKKYVVIAPMHGLIDLNGKPVSMRAEDTYYIASPGESLRLPVETVVIDDMEERELTSSDLDEVAEYWEKMFWGQYFSKDGKYDPDDKRMFGDFSYRHPSQFNSMEDFIDMQFRNMQEKMSKGLGRTRELPRSIRSFYTKLTDVIMHQTSRTHGALREKVLQIIMDKGRRFEKNEFEKAFSKLEGEFNKYFKAMLRKKKVDKTINSFGVRVEDIDPQYLEEMDLSIEVGGTYSVPDFEKAIETLATGLGISSERHPKSIEERCESSAYHYLNRLEDKAIFRDPQERTDNLNWLRNDVRLHALKLRPASRRMHYLIGTL